MNIWAWLALACGVCFTVHHLIHHSLGKRLTSIVVSFLCVLVMIETMVRRQMGLQKEREDAVGEEGFFALLRDNIAIMNDGIFAFHRDLYRRYPENRKAIRFYFAAHKSFLVRHPALIPQCLNNWPKVDISVVPEITERFKIAGRNITSAPIHEWKDIRARMVPFLGGDLLRRYEKSMTQVLQHDIHARWCEHAEWGRPLDVWENLLTYSSKVVLMAFMGLESEKVTSDIQVMLDRWIDFVRHRIMRLDLLPLWIPTAQHLAFSTHRQAIRDFVRPYIALKKDTHTMMGSIVRSNTKRIDTSVEELIDFLRQEIVETRGRYGAAPQPEDDEKAKLDLLESMSRIDLTSTGDVFALAKNVLRRLPSSVTLRDKEDEMAVRVEVFLCRQGTIDAELVLDEIIFNLLGGSETTMLTMTFATCFLSQTPAVQQRLREELRREKAEGRSVRDQIQSKGSYLSKVLDETLRLAPASYVTNRPVLQDVQFRSVDDPSVTLSVAKGEVCWASQYLVHRDPVFWKDAETFDPSAHFDLPPSPGSHFFASFGARSCPGIQYAKVEAALYLAALIESFDIRPLDPNYMLDFEGDLLLRPKERVRILLRRHDE